MQLEQVGPYLWRIPRDAERGMRVPGLVVADERLIASIRSDAALEQLANGATLPGIVRAALAMPDIHQGYGLPVGGVVATDAAHGVISPGAIGFDINCGVRLVKSSVDAADIAARMERLVDALYAAIPTGVGSRRADFGRGPGARRRVGGRAGVRCARRPRANRVGRLPRRGRPRQGLGPGAR